MAVICTGHSLLLSVVLLTVRSSARRLRYADGALRGRPDAFADDDNLSEDAWSVEGSARVCGDSDSSVE